MSKKDSTNSVKTRPATRKAVTISGLKETTLAAVGKIAQREHRTVSGQICAWIEEALRGDNESKTA